MKRIIAILSVSALVLSGCFDSREYNKEADKKCEAELKTTTNLDELLLFALDSDASPSTIKKILKKGASPICTVDEKDIPIICFAKSPNALKIMFQADPEHQEKDGPLVLVERASRNLPLFYLQSPELCEAYINLRLDNVDYNSEAYVGSVEGGKTTTLTREKVRNHLINLKDEKSRSPLFYAKNNAMIDYWLANGNKINDADSNKDNVLGYSISNNETCQIERLKYLISKGADVNFGMERANATPLARALQFNRSKEILEFLISNGAKIENIKNTSNLFYYVQNTEQIEFLQGKGLSADIITGNGFYVRGGGVRYVVRTPLAKAIANKKSIDVLKGLISAGAKVEDANFEYKGGKVSALYFAASVLEDHELTNFLMENGGEKSFDIEKVFSLFVKNEDNKMITKALELGVMPKEAKNLDKLFDILLEKSDIPNMEKVLKSGYDINRHNLRDYLNKSEGNPNAVFDFLIMHGFDVNKRDSYGSVFDRVMNNFSDINIGSVSPQAFEQIVKKTSALKDRGYAKKKLSEIVSCEGLRPEILNIFLDNCKSVDSGTIRDVLIRIFQSGSTVSESTIISLIKHVDDFNSKVNGKTMIGYALEYGSVSLDIIKAIAEKMYFPALATNYQYHENQNPIDIANKLNLSEIAQYLQSRAKFITTDNKGCIKIWGVFTFGMSKSEFESMTKIFPTSNDEPAYKGPWSSNRNYNEITPRYDEKEKLVGICFENSGIFAHLALDRMGVKKEQLVSESYSIYEYDIYRKTVSKEGRSKEILTYSSNSFNMIVSFGGSHNNPVFPCVYLAAPNARTNDNPYKDSGIYALWKDKNRGLFRIFDNKELKDNDENRKYYQSLINNGAEVK